MGNFCACRRDEDPLINEYERKISRWEKSIGWQKINIIDLVTNIKKYSRDSVLNVNSFNLACQVAKMVYADMTNPKTSGGRFFSTLLMLNGDIFLEKELVICALVLAMGSPQEKATELFQYYDKECNGNLTKQEVVDMFIDYTSFVAVILPMISVGDVSMETVEWYQRGMARNMSDVIEALMEIVCPSGTSNLDLD